MFDQMSGSGDIATLEHVVAQKETLKGRSLVDYQPLLCGIANYFLETLPRHLENDYIYEVETLVDELDKRARNEVWPQDLRQFIRDALDKVSYLSEIIANLNRGEPRGYNFFRTARSLGEVLYLVAYYQPEDK